jgi:hypothetical protein
MFPGLSELLDPYFLGVFKGQFFPFFGPFKNDFWGFSDWLYDALQSRGRYFTHRGLTSI